MGKKIYVGNLSYNLREESLRGLFSDYGTVETANVIMDRESGRSKGFAFVEMSNESDARAAIEGLNGKDHDGRALNVSEAKPMAPRENRFGSRPSRY